MDHPEDWARRSGLLTPRGSAVAGMAYLLLSAIVIAVWSLGSRNLVLLTLILMMVALGVPLCVIDIRTHRLPRPLVLPLYPVTAAVLVVDGHTGGIGRWSGVAWGVAIWTTVLGGLWLISSGAAMGMGDVTLAPPLGAALGWLGVSFAIGGLTLAFIIGAAVAVALVATRRADRRTHLPFGPMLFAGWLAAMLMGAST